MSSAADSGAAAAASTEKRGMKRTSSVAQETVEVEPHLITEDEEQASFQNAPTPPISPSSSESGEAQPPVAKKPKEEEAVKHVATLSDQLRQLFAWERGYRFRVKASFITVSVSTVSDKKRDQKRLKFGRDFADAKNKYVNVNTLFSTLPSGEAILSKFLPQLASRKEPYSIVQLTPALKLRFPHLTGMGSWEKDKYRPKTKGDAEHEFSLSVSAYRSDSVDQFGNDPDAVDWWSDLQSTWNQVAKLISRNTSVAPDLHALCKAKIESQNKAGSAAAASSTDSQISNDVPYAQLYEKTYLENFIEPVNPKLLKFSTRMFAFPTLDQKKQFEKTPYRAPTKDIQNVYDKADDEDKKIFKDLPVIRPRTKEETIAASVDGDRNPFVYVPYEERGQIQDNSIASCLYEIGITESYNNKSYLKLRPLLLIWFRDATPAVSPLQMAEAFVFDSSAPALSVEQQQQQQVQATVQESSEP